MPALYSTLAPDPSPYFSALFSQLLATYWWLLPLLIVAALFKSAWFKGFIGEGMVNMAARLFLNKNDSTPNLRMLRMAQQWFNMAL